MCWDGYYGVSGCSQAFANLAYNLNLTQLVSQPTHCVGNILDVALINTQVLHDVQIISDLPLSLQSDHFTVLFP